MLKLAILLLLLPFTSSAPQDLASNKVVQLPLDDNSVVSAVEFGSVELKEADALPSVDAAKYAYALDLSVPVTLSQLKCVKSTKYSAVFIRAFSPAGQGSFDVNSVATIRNAYSAGLGIEVYMTPQISSSLTGWQQFDLLYKGLSNNGIVVRSVWIQVTSPANWPGTIASHITFINAIISRAKQNGLIVGIYTNQYDWSQITGNWNSLSSDVLIWYWHVLGAGVTGETPATFDDFRSFGSWRTPSVKQFAQSEVVCQIAVNRNVYAVGIPSDNKKSSDFFIEDSANRVVVGSIGF